MTESTASTVDEAVERAVFDDRGLLPAIIQQWDTGEVLMLGWMDREALRRTLTEGRVTFWSRSPPGVLAQGRHLRTRAVRALRRARLRRRYAPRARRADRRRLPHRHPHLLRRRSDRRRPGLPARRLTTRRDRWPLPRPRSTNSPDCSRVAGSCPSCASCSPTARPRSASTASSPADVRARSCSSRPNRAASGRGTRSWASRHTASSPRPTTGVEWLDYGLDAERALGDAAELPPLEGPRGACTSAGAPTTSPGAPPLTGGLVGFIGWEAVRQIEHLPNRPPAESRIPGQAFSFVAELVVIDHRTGTVQLIASVLNDAGEPAADLWAGRAGATRPHAGGPRPALRGVARRHRPVARRRSAPSHRTRRLPRRGRPLQAAHPRRRRVPGGHLAAVRPRGHRGPARRVPGASQPQPEPVHVLRAPRRRRGRAVLDRRLIARGARQGAGRARVHASDRRFEAARRRRPRTTPTSRPSCSPTPRSRPST